ncbi:tripartite tricarboxylate transporter TctB family protein [Selenihalanaerobacter shriftii]|uniref:Tripartite tricarboxylate transporter TctB family protein n=1 Tax=Selenihalanaerobacter shriftii TaxID=142842 RepID=A0A1T4MUZ8_9FIRM|nr:tripartite tricarboxylate transporter TctB family protein [Selenihalanaerobacter shriftii]SJZ70930.1 Tripartite tricarboxylate transporter TctB family protein [Selenihalanaerobacter shriftii]
MGEILIGIILLILSSVVYLQADAFPVSKYAVLGPGAFPKLIAIFMGVLSLLLILSKIKDVFNKESSFNFTTVLNRYKYPFFTLMFFLIYIKLMRYIGFRISTFSFIIATQWMLGPNKMKKLPIMLVIAIILSLGSYYFFQSYLTVVFPTGILFE